MVYPTTPGLIDSFATLKAKFVAQFATNKPHQMMSIALVNIRQEKGESLKAFMARFGQVALSIRRLLPEVVMTYLITALRPGPFAHSLAIQPPTNMDDLRWRATQFMQVKDLHQFTRAVESKEMERPASQSPKIQGRAWYPKILKVHTPKYWLSTNSRRRIERGFNCGTSKRYVTLECWPK